MYLISVFYSRLIVCTTEYTESQRLLSGVHSIMRVKLAQAGEGGGCTPTPFHLHLPSPVKLQCTMLQLSGQIHYNPVSSLVKICTLWSALHCKDKIPKFRNKYFQKRNIGVSVPISTFMRLWAIYIFPRSVCLFCWRKYVDQSWDYINRSQTHECGNWGWGRTIPRKGIHKWDFSLQCVLL